MKLRFALLVVITLAFPMVVGGMPWFIGCHSYAATEMDEISVNFVGCASCHPDAVDTWNQSAHGNSSIFCDECHRWDHSIFYVASDDVGGVEVAREIWVDEFCSSCHHGKKGHMTKEWRLCLQCHEGLTHIGNFTCSGL